ncbi:MAG: hypothetical protein JO037_21845 [Actinobacteria bacterium]|nr:hypothetical protein [Actinomycetota bacterium]
MKRSWPAVAGSLALALAIAVALATVTATAAAAAPAGDGPAGFWYGTDSATVPVPGSPPYAMPVIGGSYGGYIGMTGNWANLAGCQRIVVWSSANSAQANTNYLTYHRGIGTGVYYFMGGPGVDPHYDGSTGEAYSWGQQQAARALYDASLERVTYPVIFMDIEIPGNAPNYTPAPDNGWNTVYTSACSGVVRQSYVPAAVDRADFNGFWDYIVARSSFKPGVYSAPQVWNSIFGSDSASPGSPGYIPRTDEWTYWPETANLSDAPGGWCLRSGECAQFFGGQTSSSPYAIMWQWSGGGGIRNPYGDFDQIDANRQG